MTNPTTKGAPTLQQRLTVVKHLAKGRDLDYVDQVMPDLTAEQIRVIGTSHGYPDREKLTWAVDVLTKQIDDQAKDLPPAPHREPLRDTHNANRVTRIESEPPPISRDLSGDLNAATVLDEQKAAGPLTKPDEIRVLLNTAKQSKSKRIQARANRIFDDLDRLRQLVKDEQEKTAEKRRAAERREAEKQARAAAKAQIEAEVAELERELKEKKAQLRGRITVKVTDDGPIATTPPPAKFTPGPDRTKQGAAAKARHQRQREVFDRHSVSRDDVAAWGRDNGYEVGDRGMLPSAVLDAYDTAHTTTKGNAA